MSKVSLFWCAATVAVWVAPAFADDSDPALFQNGIGSNCVATYWCASVGRAIDPNTGDVTLEFILNTSVDESEGITPFDTGWVAAVTGLTIDNLLDFEIIGGKDVIFLYCGNTLCNAADVGLPGTLPAHYVSYNYYSAPNTPGNVYTPTAGQPGYGTAYNASKGSLGVPGYAIENVGPYVSGVPEPSSVLLLGCMLLMTTGAFRRYLRP